MGHFLTGVLVQFLFGVDRFEPNYSPALLGRFKALTHSPHFLSVLGSGSMLVINAFCLYLVYSDGQILTDAAVSFLISCFIHCTAGTGCKADDSLSRSISRRQQSHLVSGQPIISDLFADRNGNCPGIRLIA